MSTKTLTALALVGLSLSVNFAQADKQSIDLSNWDLEWSDEFNYADKQLDKNWVSQNGATENPWVLSSRWRDNAKVEDGVLHLLAKKETRIDDSQPWTTGNIWSKRAFHYGYYEARMKYAEAYGTNNSFWFWPKQGVKEGQKACEIDVNEGHYPNIINSNIHNWTDTWTLPNGKKMHHDNQLHHTLDGDPGHHLTLEKPIKTKKLRLISSNPSSLHISEFRVFAPSDSYPKALDAEYDSTLVNHALAKDTSLKTNGIYNKLPSEEAFAIDGRMETRWVSKKDGPKLLELNWDEAKEIGAVQFANGWLQEFGAEKGKYRNLIADYKIQYHDGKDWIELTEFDAAKEVSDYATQWHVFGLQWDEDYFRFYKDGELFHEMRNDVCFSETTMLFSLAILKVDIAGPVTDAIDGTSMKVDWVRYYTPKD
ncbi:family 16 glycosylhydrolase [Agaribacterium sp. ZY112]|uniref:family 16 glycosylhydrolase n=1 Tax=Agaribacterium sp. ZY112 TaxID=3233574 RepID=UPI003526743E